VGVGTGTPCCDVRVDDPCRINRARTNYFNDFSSADDITSENLSGLTSDIWDGASAIHSPSGVGTVRFSTNYRASAQLFHEDWFTFEAVLADSLPRPAPLEFTEEELLLFAQQGRRPPTIEGSVSVALEGPNLVNNGVTTSHFITLRRRFRDESTDLYTIEGNGGFETTTSEFSAGDKFGVRLRRVGNQQSYEFFLNSDVVRTINRDLGDEPRLSGQRACDPSIRLVINASQGASPAIDSLRFGNQNVSSFHYPWRHGNPDRFSGTDFRLERFQEANISPIITGTLSDFQFVEARSNASGFSGVPKGLEVDPDTGRLFGLVTQGAASNANFSSLPSQINVRATDEDDNFVYSGSIIVQVVG